MSKESQSDKLNCSFCGKVQDEVKKLMLDQVYTFVMNVLTCVMILLKKKSKMMKILLMMSFYRLWKFIMN